MSASDPRINSVIAGKYRIEKRIARGGMGSVYLATHEMMNRKVAIKLLHENLSKQDQAEVFFKRFLREARAASRLEHPNAVTIYDFGLEGDIPYLAMQYIEGRNISALIAQHGPFPLEQALSLFTQICSAIQAAHEIKIAHRDIKPDNIIIQNFEAENQSAHVLDFGIAKAMEGSATMVGAMTAVGKTVGTPRYMSPEQALGKEVDLRTDVYSLGILFYEMIVGDIPFSAATPVELMYEHLNSEPKPLPKSLGLKKEFEERLFKAIAKNPEDRPETPNELAQSLHSALNDSHIIESTTTGFPIVKSAMLLSLALVICVAIWFHSGSELSPQIRPKKSEQEIQNALMSLNDELENQASSKAVEPDGSAQDGSGLENARIESNLVDNNEDTQEQDASETSPETTFKITPKRETIAELIAVLGSEQREERIEAAIKLQQRGDESVNALIVALKNSPSARVRYLSAFILGKLKSRKAIPALKQATKDESGMVATTANRALATIYQ